MAPSALERCLRLFTEVRAGEGRNALLMFANVLLILCAYYLIKPLREGWLAVSGIEGLTRIELKAYSSFAQSALLIGVTVLYGRLVGHWPRAVLIVRTTLFCMAVIGVFWALQPDVFIRHLPGTGIAFYLWVGMFGVFVVAQFWAFAADLYSDEGGRRLLPLIAIGATSGAVVGSWIAERLVTSGLLATESLLLAALVPLGGSVLLTQAVSASAGPTPPKVRLSGIPIRGTFGLLASSRFLMAVAVITLLLNCVNTNGENLLWSVVQETLHHDVDARGIQGEAAVRAYIRDGTAAFYGDFYFWVNLVALVLQALVASRLLRYGGFGAIFLLLPCIALGSYTAMALLPVLGVIKVMKIAENATDYSLHNTARHVLWLPLTPDVTYRAKTAIDTLFARAGDGVAALTVMLGVHVFAFSNRAFFTVNISLVLVWLGTALWVVRRHAHLSDSGAEHVQAEHA